MLVLLLPAARPAAALTTTNVDDPKRVQPTVHLDAGVRQAVKLSVVAAP